PAWGPDDTSMSIAQLSRLAPPVSCFAAVTLTGLAIWSARNPSKWTRKSFKVVMDNVSARGNIASLDQPDVRSEIIVHGMSMNATEKWVRPVRRRIYLLRHGDVSYFDRDGQPHRPDTVPLNAEGRLQAEAACRALAEIPIDRIVSSDLA